MSTIDSTYAALREESRLLRAQLSYEQGRVDDLEKQLRHEAEQGRKAREDAIELAVRYGGIDGDHHKAWVIDQMVRALAGDGYAEVVRNACDGSDGPNTFDWDEGIAP